MLIWYAQLCKLNVDWTKHDYLLVVCMGILKQRALQFFEPCTCQQSEQPCQCEMHVQTCRASQHDGTSRTISFAWAWAFHQWPLASASRLQFGMGFYAVIVGSFAS